MSDAQIDQWKQANKIYAQLMDLTVSAALSQLNQMAGLDDEIKGMVLSLISSGNLPSQFFKQQVGANFEMEGLHQINYQVGDVIDGYELSDPLGTGGMAVVYKAKKVEVDSHKPVAIKVFNRSDFSPILQNRFIIEQEILSGLSHPNIVNMHHGGTSDQGLPYIVMDLIEQAKDIDVYAKQSGADLKQIIKWVLSAAKAIAYAHNNLIVHRDIKPSNLLIDGNGRLKVVDFGIAKLMTRDDSPQKTTIMALTPSFAAPEQINSGQISVSTDVFSLAAVCLALIIEELPLPADRLLKSCAGDEEHIWQVLRTKVKDKDLRNILNQAMQQEPSKRYQNMGLLVDDLTAWLAYKPVLATPDSWLYRIKKFAKRRSALFAALSTLMVMVVLGILLLSWQVNKTQREASKANEVKNFMLDVFSVINPDESQGERILAKDLLSQAFAEIQAREFQDIGTKTDLLTAMGQAQLQLGLRQSASSSFSVALELNPNAVQANLGALDILLDGDDFIPAQQKIDLLERLVPSDDPSSADLKMLKAKLAIDTTKDYVLADVLTTQAQQIYQDADNIKGYLTAARQLANILYIQSQPEEAASLLEQQLESALQQLAPTHTVVMAIKNDLIDLYNDVGNYEKGSQHSSELIEDIQKILGERHPFLIQAYLSQAGIQRATGELEASKASANLALELSKSLNGEKHELTARAINFLGVLNYVDGDIEASLENMQLAASIYEEVLGDDHLETWEIKTNLTVLLNLSGRFDEAIATVEPVYQKQVEVLGAGHKATIYSQTALARLYGEVGRLDEAQLLGESMLKQAIQELGMAHPLTAGGHFSLAQIYQQQGQFSAAIELIETVLKNEGWDEKNERVIGTYNTLADLYLSNGDAKTATEFKEKSLEVAINILTEESPRAWTQMLNNFEFYLKIKKPEKANIYRDKLTEIFAENEATSETLLARFKQLNSGGEASH